MSAQLRHNAIVKDGWLIEMLYRQAVNSQVQIFQKCAAALEEIWQSMHRIEVNRQIRLHEVMLDFMPRQRRLFLGLSPIPGPVLHGLVELRTDPKETDDQLEEEIRKRMQGLLKIDNDQRSYIMNRGRAQAPNFEELHGMLTGEFFDNGLLRAAEIVERWTGYREKWKTTLVVVTGDNYLHMFDVSNIPEVVIGSPAEPVFELLLPDYDFPSLDSGVVEPRVDSLLKQLTPTETVYLAKCSSTGMADDARTVEIIESGVKDRIGFESTRKFTIRTIAAIETQQWLVLLQSCQSGSAAPEIKPTVEQALAESVEEQQVKRAVQNAEAALARV